MVANANRDVFRLVAARIQIGDDLSSPAEVQLLLDPVHACLPLTLVRRCSLDCGNHIFKGVKQAEDECLFPSTEDLLAGIAESMGKMP